MPRPQINFDLDDYKRALQKLGPMLAKKNVRIIFKGTSCYTDGDKIVLPELSVVEKAITSHEEVEEARDFLAALRGFIDHECGHVVFSDFDVLESEKPRGRLKAMANAIEDVFIERKMSELFPGAGAHFKDCDEYCLRERRDHGVGKTQPFIQLSLYVLVAGKYGPDHWFIDNLDPGISALGRMLAPMIDRIATIKSTAETLVLAKEIVDYVEDYAKEQEEEQKSSGELGESSSGLAEDEDYEEGEGAEGESHEDSEHDEEDDGDEEDADMDDAAPEETEHSEEAEQEAEEAEQEDEEGAGEGEEEGDEEGGDGAEEGGEEGEEESEEGGEEERGDEGSDEGSVEEGGEEESEEGEEGTGDGGDEDEDEDEDGESSGTEDENGDDEGDDLTEEEKEAARAMAEQSLEGDDADIEAEEEKQSEATVMSRKAASFAETDDVYRPYTTENDTSAMLSEVSEARLGRLEDETRSVVGSLQREVKNVLKSKTHEAWIGEQDRGKLDRRSLYKLPIGQSNRIFRQPAPRLDLSETVVSIWCDSSGSMGWDHKMDVARTTLFALGEVLDAVNVPFEMWGFTTEASYADSQWKSTPKKLRQVFTRYGALVHHGVKEFHEPWKLARRRLPNLCPEQNSYEGESLATAAAHIRFQRQKRKVIFLLSDGYPECAWVSNRAVRRGTGSFEAYEWKRRRHHAHLRETVKSVEDSGIEVIGVGVCSNAVAEFYTKYVVVNDASDLAGQMLAQLKRVLLPNARL